MCRLEAHVVRDSLVLNAVPTRTHYTKSREVMVWLAKI